MKIACVSDMHGKLDKALLPAADVLIIAGDYCPNFIRGPINDAKVQKEWIEDVFNPFLNKTDYEKIIVVAGNHDWTHYYTKPKYTGKVQYLEDSSLDYKGLLIYGSPWQPWFHDWAFNFPRYDTGQAAQVWSLIPEDTNILITHSPPWMVGDACDDERHVGCPELYKRLIALKKLKLHVFGHVHHSYGQVELGSTTYVNAALCDECYDPVNPIQVVDV